MQNFKKYIEKLAPVTGADWEYFTSKVIVRNFEKKAQILTAGETENYLSFVKSGVLRLYIPNAYPEKEITFSFCFPGEFMSAYDSFLAQKPSMCSIEALSDTSLWSISYDDVQAIYKNTQVGNTIGRISCERLFFIKFRRELSFINKSAEERYKGLLNKHASLFEDIPLKYIASYIGITPQALSRIRKRISNHENVTSQG